MTAQASGSALAPFVLTEGSSDPTLAEFAIADPGTCGSSSGLSTGQTCTVSVTFSPRYPGVRHGAVEIVSSGGEVLASTLISGLGQGSLPVLVPGEMSTVAGNGLKYYGGDGGAATSASLYLPSGIVVDGAGNLYIADTSNNRVRCVAANTDPTQRIITTIAGNGSAGAGGDGGLATSAQLSNPTALAMDGAGNLYIADTGNHAIRRVQNASCGGSANSTLTTYAGTLQEYGYSGDGGLATSARLDAPQGLALSASGDLIIADTLNHVIRVVTASDGNIQTIAGNGHSTANPTDMAGDGGPATQAQFNNPTGVAIGADGTIAVADLYDNRVRVFTVGGAITTIAGNGNPGYSGDGDPAAGAELQGPTGVAFDPAGDLFIADNTNDCIRLVYGPQNTIVTLSGINTDGSFAGDNGPANAARMHFPLALFFDAGGSLWFSDQFNNRIRQINGSLLIVGPVPPVKQGKTSPPYVEGMINAGNLSLTSSPATDQAKLDSTVSVPFPECGQSSVSPSGFCSMAIEFAPTVAGTRTGTPVNGSITWDSNARNITPLDKIDGTVLSVEPTTVTIDPSSGPNPGTLNESINLIGIVSSADTSRVGTVDFVEGNYTWCSAVPLGADGKASCQIPSLTLGSHTFLAKYSGDENNAASQSPAYTEVIKQQAALALGTSTSPAVVTSNVSLTVSAADANGGTPTGTVIFYDGTTPLATVTLDSNGNASWSTTSFSLGSHTLTAQYSGDNANVPGTSNTRTLQINAANTVTDLSSANNDATVGSSVTLNSKVVTDGGPAPTGTVQFLDGQNLIGSGPLSSGSATLTTSALSPGRHSLTAVYSGDTDNASSTSSAMTQTIEQIATVTTLGADVDPANAGATIHLSAIVSLAPGANPDGALGGTVTFFDRGTTLGTAVVNASGQATLAMNTLTVGTHAITATYNGTTNYATSSSTSLAETVQQTATALVLTSASSAILMGNPATFTAQVTSTTGVPAGAITFKDGPSILGTARVDSRGSATFSTSQLSAGTHSIIALYGGDANYLPTSSQAILETVTLAETSLALSGPTSKVDAGTLARFAVTLTTPGLNPSGTVKLLDGATVIGSLPVTGAGVFSFSTAQLSVGNHQILATYSGDVNNSASASAVLLVTVQQAGTGTALTASANPLTEGLSLTLRASVTSDSPNAGGSVTFYDGSTLLGSAALSSIGTASLVPPNLTVGLHTLTAVYGGDTNHAGSTSAALPELVVQASSMTVSSSANPSVSGETVSFTGVIKGSPTPTGSMSFRDNGLLLATVPLDASGAAAFSSASLSVGQHAIEITYGGDSHFATSQGQITQAVLNATTSTSISTDANPAVYGKLLTLSVVVGSNGGTATGKVNLTDGSTIIGSAELASDGHATFTTASLSPGAHSLAAFYPGDGRANPSNSGPLPLVVKQVTTLLLNSNANPTQTLSNVVFKATVNSPGAAPVTGAVTFTEGSTVLGTSTLDKFGSATLTVPQMSAGTHVVIASYDGDGANFASATQPFSEVVQLRPTATTVTGSATDTANPQQITLIAVVHGTGSVPPGGTVTFTSGAITLGASQVDATGVATITVIFDTQTQQIEADYMGDASYAGSQSAVTPITAGQPAQFTLAVNTPSISLVSHQRTTVTVTIESVRGFTDNINLGCLGLPYAATCTFDHSQIKLNSNGTVTASLVIDTGDPLGAGTNVSAAVQESRKMLLCFSPLALLLAGLQRKNRKRRLPFLLCLLCAFLMSSSLVGCGGLQTSGTPPGTYTFKVIGTGQGSNTTEAQPMTMVVTQ